MKSKFTAKDIFLYSALAMIAVLMAYLMYEAIKLVVYIIRWM